MFRSKKEKLISSYLKNIAQHQNNIFEQVLLKYVNKTLLKEINVLPNGDWSEEFDFFTEKDVKKMMKNADQFNTPEELIEMRKEICEGFSLELTLFHNDSIFTIVFNKEYLTINLIGDDSEVYDKHFDITTYLTVDDLLVFIHNELMTFDNSLNVKK